jgi:hypothetical protein
MSSQRALVGSRLSQSCSPPLQSIADNLSTLAASNRTVCIYVAEKSGTLHSALAAPNMVLAIATVVPVGSFAGGSGLSRPSTLVEPFFPTRSSLS